MKRTGRMLGAGVLAASIACLAVAEAASTPATISPDEIKPGMKGYGLSVFKGTKPERFDVEVVDVLKNVFPKMDLILVRCAGQNLEKTKVIAGMSGSPVYLEGRLAGAISYGWEFSNEPVAGVTPIGNMLAEAARPLEFSAAPRAASREGLRPVSVPLVVSGCPPALFERLRERFGRRGWTLMQGAGGGAPSLRGEPEPTLEPGAAIGVQLLRGDWDMTAIGTVTWSDGKKVVAFGHPFLEAGELHAPMTTAFVHGVLSSQATSFKFASPVKTVGSLVQDRLACVAGVIGTSCRMLPLRVRVENVGTGAKKELRLEVIRNEGIVTELVIAALVGSVLSSEVYTEEMLLTAEYTLRIRLEGKAGLPGETIERSDRFPGGGAPLDFGMVDPFLELLFNSLGKVSVESMEWDIKVERGAKAARIERTRFLRRRAAPGERVPLEVTFRPYRQKPVVRLYDIEIPKDAPGGAFPVRIGSATDISPDPAPPETTEDIIRKLKKFHRSTDLAVSWSPVRPGLFFEGRSIKNLPASYLEAFLQGGETGAMRSSEPEWVRFETPWVIMGGDSASIEVDRRGGQ